MDEGIKCAAFMGGQGAKARGIAYCNDGTTPTLKSVPSGSNTVPDVVICLQGGGTTSSGHQNGSGWNDSGTAYTVNAVDVHGICYGISRSMLKGGMNAGGMPVEEQVQPAMTSNGCGAVCYDMRSIRNMGDKAMTLLSTMHKGANANGCSIVLMEIENENIPNDNRGAVREQPSGELHRTGCIQRYASGDQEAE